MQAQWLKKYRIFFLLIAFLATPLYAEKSYDTCPYYKTVPTSDEIPTDIVEPKNFDEARLDTVTAKKLYQLLKDVHELFTKNRITYWVEAGTLLGAVRHEGFIPWDDDADVCIVKSQEAEFKRLIPTLEKLGYKVVTSLFGYKIFYKNGQNVDRCPWTYPYMDVILTRVENGKVIYDGKEVHKNMPSSHNESDLYPLKEYKFGTFKVMGPNNPLPYLNAAYRDWNNKAVKGAAIVSLKDDPKVKRECRIHKISKDLTDEDKKAAPIAEPLEERVH